MKKLKINLNKKKNKKINFVGATFFFFKKKKKKKKNYHKFRRVFGELLYLWNFCLNSS